MNVELNGYFLDNLFLEVYWPEIWSIKILFQMQFVMIELATACFPFFFGGMGMIEVILFAEIGRQLCSPPAVSVLSGWGRI